jgi:RNA polymerase sigma-70 factor (ECF subfamily)
VHHAGKELNFWRAEQNLLATTETGVMRDESALIERIRKGDKALFYELIRPYERSVYLSAYSVLRNQADAEEVVQETLLKAFTHLDQLRENDKFKAWLLLIAVNESRMRRRKDRQYLYESLEEQTMQTEEGEFMPRQFADWRDIPSDVAERKEIKAAVRTALDMLPDKYRTVFVLRDMQHLSVAETATVLGITVSAVKTQLHRARLQMREQLAPIFGKRWTERLPFGKGKNPW